MSIFYKARSVALSIILIVFFYTTNIWYGELHGLDAQGKVLMDKPYFGYGVLAYIFMFSILTSIGWFVYLAPLNGKNHLSESENNLSQRRYKIIAIIIGISFIIFTLGGASWDVTWHLWLRTDDTAWLPHILGIYPWFLVIGVTVVICLGQVLAKSRNNARKEKDLGLIIILGIFFLLTSFSDPVWHVIYGKDITAFSLPHALTLLAIILMGMSIAWLCVRKIKNGTTGAWRALAVICLAGSWADFFLTFTSEFELQIQPSTDVIFQLRPNWYYPAMICLGGLTFVLVTKKLIPKFWSASVVIGLVVFDRVIWGLIGGTLPINWNEVHVLFIPSYLVSLIAAVVFDTVFYIADKKEIPSKFILAGLGFIVINWLGALDYEALGIIKTISLEGVIIGILANMIIYYLMVNVILPNHKEVMDS